MKFAAFALWLGLVSISAFTAGTMKQQGNPTSWSTGETLRLPPCCSMVKTIPMMIVDSAMRHGLSPSRALARAWKESKYQDIDSACCRGPMQLSRRYWPRMTAEQNVDAGVSFLAEKIRKHGALAEEAYRWGHIRRIEWEVSGY